MSTIFSSFLSRYCETNYRHKRHWRPILDLLECWKNAISRSTLVIKLSSITYSMVSCKSKRVVWQSVNQWDSLGNGFFQNVSEQQRFLITTWGWEPVLTLFQSGGYQIDNCMPFSLYLGHGFCSESKQPNRNRVNPMN